MSFGLRLFYLLIVCVTASYALDGDNLPPTATVEAKLIAISDPPDPAAEDVWVYGEGLVLSHYQVVKVVNGELKDKDILVTQWGIKRRLSQPVMATKVGDTVTLKLCPFADVDKVTKLGEVYCSNTLKDEKLAVTAPTFHDVGQALVMPDEGRWNYKVDLSRTMRAFHLLKNQLKLVVIGDCQTWFSSRTELFYGDENLKTPVALSMTQERSYLGMYDCLVNDYLLRLPKLEWVVVGFQNRWVNGKSGWKGKGQKVQEFKSSAGYKYDMAHADEVFKQVDHAPITLEQIKAIPEVAAKWEECPWGALKDVPGKGKNVGGKVNSAFSQKQWDDYEMIVKKLVDKKIKVLAYILPVAANSAKQDAKDKAGTSAADYDIICGKHRELVEKYQGYYFFLDYNDKGNHGLDTGKDFCNEDHLSTAGAIKCTTTVEAYRLKCEAGAK